MRRRKAQHYIIQKDYECPECEQPCTAIACDGGIGPGEAWGVPFNDEQPYIGSSCCEAELEDAEYDYDYYEE